MEIAFLINRGQIWQKHDGNKLILLLRRQITGIAAVMFLLIKKLFLRLLINAKLVAQK